MWGMYTWHATNKKWKHREATVLLRKSNLVDNLRANCVPPILSYYGKNAIGAT